MAPPLKFETVAILAALREATSLRAAAVALGMSQGALAKRCKRKGGPLIRVWLQTRKRGIDVSNPNGLKVQP